MQTNGRLRKKPDGFTWGKKDNGWNKCFSEQSINGRVKPINPYDEAHCHCHFTPSSSLYAHSLNKRFMKALTKE